jgi:hypothetical protein
MRLVLDSGNHHIGTLRKKRAGIPPLAKFAKSGAGKRDRGDILMHKTEVGGKPVYLSSWMDNKPVMVLSSLESKVFEVDRAVQVRNTNVWNTIKIPAPTIIPLYNEGMGGTDGIDQHISYYRPRVKSLSWGPRIYSHLMAMAVINAYLIKIDKEKLDRKVYRHLDFLKALIDQLAAPSLRINEADTNAVRTGRYLNRDQWNIDNTRLQGRHFPQIVYSPREEGAGRSTRGEAISLNRNLKRGRCMMCGQSVNSKCEQCECYLCISIPTGIHDGEYTCWKKFHTCRDFIEDEEL